MRQLWTLLILLLSWPPFSRAEYRMFTLKITNTQTQDFRLVDSTLDPLQYPFYYPVQANEIVQYIDTWRCYGRTGPWIPPCPSPRKKAAAEENPSQQNEGPVAPANP